MEEFKAIVASNYGNRWITCSKCASYCFYQDKLEFFPKTFCKGCNIKVDLDELGRDVIHKITRYNCFQGIIKLFGPIEPHPSLE